MNRSTWILSELIIRTSQQLSERSLYRRLESALPGSSSFVAPERFETHRRQGGKRTQLLADWQLAGATCEMDVSQMRGRGDLE